MKKISAIMKKNDKLWPIYQKLSVKFKIAVSNISPTILSKWQYQSLFGRKIDLKQPKTFNEKLMYLKLRKYWNNTLISQCADKYLVREYVISKGCSELLTTLLGVWEKADDISWESLPQKFIIKCNHGCRFNIICTNKDLFDIQKASDMLNTWLKQSYGDEYAEQGIYGNIKRKIICESYIETQDGLPPKDYKFFCVDGKVNFLYVASRPEGDLIAQEHLDFYYPDWTYIPVKREGHECIGPIEKPLGLEQMIYYAEKLSKGFPFVRVDLYNEGGKIYFGELTFTPCGCLGKYIPEEYDTIFGKMLPSINEIEEWEI